MIETLPERPPKAPVNLPAEVAASFAAFRGALSARSQLVWGEHCSECAYPACYAQCAFYTPRSDFNCRRFEAGFEPLTADPALHRVRFRQWGKVQARGPAALIPMSRAAARDRRDAGISRLIAVLPAPLGLKLAMAWHWSWGKREVASTGVAAADGFVVEAWSCDGRTHPFTLTLMNVEDYGGRMVQVRFEVGSAYSRLLVPLAEIAAEVDLDRPYLAQIEPIGAAEGVQAVFGVCDFVSLRAATQQNSPSPGAAKPAKVVVWDLDETLWTGVLGEDGAQGVRLRPEAANAIRGLDARGVLQSVASKNDRDEALAALRGLGLEDYFLHPQIHWDPKSGSVAAIAKALDLNLDSVVFIDDQAFERAEVQTAHPSVRALPHTAVATLLDHAWFDLPVTAESRKRRSLYRAEALRVDACQDTGGDYGGFLRASNIRLRIDALAMEDVERVFELSQRTNQLNFTGRKYGRDEVRALQASKLGATGLCLRCSDRFGDYGLIGFAAVDFADGAVSELFLSCRVQRKRVEHAFTAWLGAEMAGRGAREMRIAYEPTGRNGAAGTMLRTLGFAPSQTGAGFWSRPSADPIDQSDIVAVVARTAVMAA